VSVYRVPLTRRATKDLRRLDASVRQRVLQAREAAASTKAAFLQIRVRENRGVTEHRAITGARADLRGTRAPESLHRLLLEGPGIRSIAGIEQMHALEELTMERLPAPDLGRLAGLPALRGLTVVNLRGPVAWHQLERLTGLEHLFVATADRAEAERIAAVQYGHLPKLRVLRLNHDGGRVRIELSWLERLSNLELFSLNGFVFDDKWLDQIVAAPSLEDVVITPRSTGQFERLLAARPAHLGVNAFDVDIAPLGVILEHKTAGGMEFSVGLDLAGQWDLETNIEAERKLVRLLQEQAPDIADRLRFDTESSAVWVVARQRGDLEAVQRVAAAR
jgi:hypothetical protein